MGEVYKARDTKLDRDVAIKILPSHLSTDPEALARFEREAKAVAALSHPNILAIHDFGREPASGVSYAVMELLEGGTLRERLADGPAAEEGCPDWCRHRARPRRRACARPGAPGPEARERVRHGRRPREDSRFRPGAPGDAGQRRSEFPDRAAPDRTRHGPWDGRVHVARTGQRTAGRSPLGPVFTRLCPVQTGHWPPGIPARDVGGNDDSDPPRGSAGPRTRGRLVAWSARAGDPPLSRESP